VAFLQAAVSRGHARANADIPNHNGESFLMCTSKSAEPTVKKAPSFIASLSIAVIAISCGVNQAYGQCNSWTGGPALNGSAHDAIIWDQDGAGPIPPKLVVGGTFTMAGSLTVGHLAMWDGTSWSTLGAGLPGNVLALAILNGELIAAGNFTNNINGVISRHIAKWNGSSWVAVGGGINDPGVVTSLAVYNGELFAGGTFTTPGSRIVRLVGGVWQSLGSGTNAAINGLSEWNGSLVVCGNFTTAGPISAQRMALWSPATGGTWQTFSPPLTPANSFLSASRTHIFNGELIACGTWFDSTGSVSPCVSKFNGTSWLRMGNGVTNVGLALTTYNNQLYIGGGFLQSSSTILNRIGRWDGTNWQPLGAGLNGSVNKLTVFNNELIALGSFTLAGTTTVSNWARWRTPILPIVTSQPQSVDADPPQVVRFEITATTPFPPLTYQWRRNGLAISNGYGGASVGGGDIDGATVDELRIDDVRWTDAGLYDCIITSGCGSVTTASAVLTYSGGCRPDINNSGTLTVQDIFDFLALYFAGNARGDFNISGVISVQDIFDFLAVYFSGCT